MNRQVSKHTLRQGLRTIHTAKPFVLLVGRDEVQQALLHVQAALRMRNYIEIYKGGMKHHRSFLGGMGPVKEGFPFRVICVNVRPVALVKVGFENGRFTWHVNSF